MDERRKHIRVRARLQCSLLITTSGKRYQGLTSNISFGGAEFEASESMTRDSGGLTPGSVAILSFSMRRMGNTMDIKFPCRVCFVSANRAGLEYTMTLPTIEQRHALEKMLETGSSNLD